MFEMIPVDGEGVEQIDADDERSCELVTSSASHRFRLAGVLLNRFPSSLPGIANCLSGWETEWQESSSARPQLHLNNSIDSCWLNRCYHTFYGVMSFPCYFSGA
jgi:hypothetical protein